MVTSCVLSLGSASRHPSCYSVRGWMNWWPGSLISVGKAWGVASHRGIELRRGKPMRFASISHWYECKLSCSTHLNLCALLEHDPKNSWHLGENLRVGDGLAALVLLDCLRLLVDLLSELRLSQLLVCSCLDDLLLQLTRHLDICKASSRYCNTELVSTVALARIETSCLKFLTLEVLSLVIELGSWNSSSCRRRSLVAARIDCRDTGQTISHACNAAIVMLMF